jgi:hypothetical protein
VLPIRVEFVLRKLVVEVEREKVLSLPTDAAELTLEVPRDYNSTEGAPPRRPPRRGGWEVAGMRPTALRQ